MELRDSREVHGIKMERFYGLAKISRQGFYRALARRLAAKDLLEAVKPLVNDYRSKKDRRAGSRTLYYNLDVKGKFGLGVNAFERLMSSGGLTLAKFNSKVITTRSCEQSKSFKNLTKGLVINGVNQLVVGDLTYLMSDKEVFYLFLLTDVYSARIVGYMLGDRMRAVEAAVALDNWAMLRGGKAGLEGCIHHTDGGGQYFSKLYMGKSKKLGLNTSVADGCLENGFAEQRNGLFKQHLLPTTGDFNLRSLSRKLEEVFYFYNHERKQMALGWLSPAEFEERWAGQPEPPLMKIYDRDAGTRTRRFGFLEASGDENGH